MCVIFIAEKNRPSPVQLEAMFETNKDGFGIAYRSGDKKVKWVKGLLDLKEAQKLVAEAPLPFVGHFRIQTVGGKRAVLCHPFPIELDSSLALEGETDGFVLFHNGHWGEWRRATLDAVFNTGTPLPKGKWSDSRAMAWSAAKFGISILDFIDEKSVAFGPAHLKKSSCQISGNGWTERNGMFFSNLNWESRVHGIEHRNDWRQTGAHTPSRPISPRALMNFPYDGDEDVLPVVPANHIPRGHKFYVENMCISPSCSEDRVGGTKYCVQHAPAGSIPGIVVINRDSKKVEEDHDKATIKSITKDLKCTVDGCQNNVDAANSVSLCWAHRFHNSRGAAPIGNGTKCLQVGCRKQMAAGSVFCDEHEIVKRGGPSEIDPFAQLKAQYERGDISKKQMKKERKKLDSKLFGRTGSRAEKKRAKKRWRLPQSSSASQLLNSVH